MLKIKLIALYRKMLRTDFGLDTELIDGFEEGMEPVVYSALINKHVSTRPRIVCVAKSFKVPSECEKGWERLRADIEQGSDISQYLSKDIKSWNKADFLLFCTGVAHVHIVKSKLGGGGAELVFGVFQDDCFYALKFGDHRDAYEPRLLIEIAEENWPGVLFIKAQDEQTEGYYSKRLANDPGAHFNLFKPAGLLAGHQHTVLTTLMGTSGEVRNIPMKSVCAYNNEVEYLALIENKLVEKFGALVEVDVVIDFARRRYKVIIARGFKYFYYNFTLALTVSGQVADHVARLNQKNMQFNDEAQHGS